MRLRVELRSHHTNCDSVEMEMDSSDSEHELFDEPWRRRARLNAVGEAVEAFGVSLQPPVRSSTSVDISSVSSEGSVTSVEIVSVSSNECSDILTRPGKISTKKKRAARVTVDLRED